MEMILLEIHPRGSDSLTKTVSSGKMTLSKEGAEVSVSLNGSLYAAELQQAVHVQEELNFLSH